jgi:sulfate adenylyltransferase
MAATAVVAQAPHGGRLCELIPEDQALVADLKQEAKMLKKLRLSQRQVCDLELLLNGGFSPLRGFLNKEDYDRFVITANTISSTLKECRFLTLCATSTVLSMACA